MLWFCFSIARIFVLSQGLGITCPIYVPTCHISCVTCPQIDTLQIILNHALVLPNDSSKLVFSSLQGLRIPCSIYASTCHVSPVTGHVSSVTCPQIHTFWIIPNHVLVWLSNSSHFLFCCKDWECLAAFMLPHVMCHLSPAHVSCPQLETLQIITNCALHLLSNSSTY